MEVFYEFCVQNRYIGYIFIEEDGTVEFRIKKGKCACVYRLTAIDIQRCKDLPALMQHVTRWLEMSLKREEARVRE